LLNHGLAADNNCVVLRPLENNPPPPHRLRAHRGHSGTLHRSPFAPSIWWAHYVSAPALPMSQNFAHLYAPHCRPYTPHCFWARKRGKQWPAPPPALLQDDLNVLPLPKLPSTN